MPIPLPSSQAGGDLPRKQFDASASMHTASRAFPQALLCNGFHPWPGVMLPLQRPLRNQTPSSSPAFLPGASIVPLPQHHSAANLHPASAAEGLKHSRRDPLALLCISNHLNVPVSFRYLLSPCLSTSTSFLLLPFRQQFQHQRDAFQLFSLRKTQDPNSF